MPAKASSLRLSCQTFYKLSQSSPSSRGYAKHPWNAEQEIPLSPLVVVGQVGAGKTSALMYLALEDASNGRQVYSTIELKPDFAAAHPEISNNWHLVLDLPKLFRERLVAGVAKPYEAFVDLLVLDEVSILMPARQSMDRWELIVSNLGQMSRKCGFQLLMACPLLSGLDKRLRNLMDGYIIAAHDLDDRGRFYIILHVFYSDEVSTEVIEQGTETISPEELEIVWPAFESTKIQPIEADILINQLDSLLMAETESSTETEADAGKRVFVFLKSRPNQAFTLFELETEPELKPVTLDNIKDAVEQLANYRRILLVKKGRGFRVETAYCWVDAQTQASPGGAQAAIEQAADPMLPKVLRLLSKKPLAKDALLAQLSGNEDAASHLRSYVRDGSIVSRRSYKAGAGYTVVYSKP
ncbi:MAG: ATP-binding protein [Thaumarchaeota archaeon]|nr:ATP-binding protein [Nitrososphaerota archaeon]